MSLIITHPGSAHFDEFFAIALILATYRDEKFIIARRDPTPEELDTPAVWVVDVGERHEPALHNFDHHQDINHPASFMLVARHLGLDGSFRHMPWWTFKDRIDRFGPFNVARELGIKTLLPTYSPLENWFIGLFEKNPMDVLPLQRSFGQHMIDTAERLVNQLEFWQTCRTVTLKGKRVLIGLTEDTTGLQRYCAQMALPATIALTHDSRSGGWRLARINDARGVDFSKLDGHPDIRFTHKSGFMAKTNRRMPIDEVLQLVNQAID